MDVTTVAINVLSASYSVRSRDFDIKSSDMGVTSFVLETYLESLSKVTANVAKTIVLHLLIIAFFVDSSDH